METAKLTELLRGAKKMLMFTGAGISTGSGIPDFRGLDGVRQRRQAALGGEGDRWQRAILNSITPHRWLAVAALLIATSWPGAHAAEPAKPVEAEHHLHSHR